MTVREALVAAIPLAVLALAIKRLARYRDPATRSFTHFLAALALAKLFRVPVITDNDINPVLRRWTGIANLCSFAGMACGAMALVALLGVGAYITGRPARSPARVLTGTVLVTAMFVTFLRSPASKTPTSYMTRDFPPTGDIDMLVYWIVFLAAIAIPAAVLFVYTARARQLVRRGPFARVLAALATTSLLGVVYCAHKVVDLTLSGLHSHDWYAQHAKTIGLVLVLGPIITAGYACVLYLTAGLPDRVRRFRTLRAMLADWRRVAATSGQVVLDATLIPNPSPWSIWRASRDSMAAHRVMVELADAATGSPTPA